MRFHLKRFLFFYTLTFAEKSFADSEIWTYFQNEFSNQNQCRLISVHFSPYFILNNNFEDGQQNYAKGSLVDYSQKKIIRTSSEQKTKMFPSPIDPHFLDEAKTWNIQILNSSIQQNLPFDLNQKILKINQENNRYLLQQCCSGNHCELLPVFDVYDKNKNIQKISFHPQKSTFIESYRLLPAGDQTTTQKAPLQTLTHQTQVISLSEALKPSKTTPTPATHPQPVQKIVCTQNQALKIYTSDFKSIIYRIQRFQDIKIFQSWNGTNQEVQHNGLTYVHVQATKANGESVDGWAASDYIKKPSDCPDFSLIGSPKGDTLIAGSTLVVDTNKGDYRFPTEQRPTLSYSPGSGRRYFGAQREDGRKHAACDLFRPQDEKVFSISQGKILQKYLFYAGTYAIEVLHNNGWIARYGEVSAQNIAHSAPGDTVLKGQHIGNIGRTRMLHFELFSGSASGPLTQTGNSYSRRSDLLNPTSHLQKWENETF